MASEKDSTTPDKPATAEQNTPKPGSNDSSSWGSSFGTGTWDDGTWGAREPSNVVADITEGVGRASGSGTVSGVGAATAAAVGFAGSRQASEPPKSSSVYNTSAFNTAGYNVPPGHDPGFNSGPNGPLTLLAIDAVEEPDTMEAIRKPSNRYFSSGRHFSSGMVCPKACRAYRHSLAARFGK
jgi:hypothetical protein